MLPQLKRVDYIADPDKPVLTHTLLRDIVKTRINNMVNRVKDSPVTTWAAPVLLGLILSYTVYNGQATNNELKELNRAVVVLQTEKNELEKQNERERQEKFQLVREQEAWRENLKNSIIELQYALKDKLPKRREN